MSDIWANEIEPTQNREDGLSVLMLSLLLCERLPIVFECSRKWRVGDGMFDRLRLLCRGRTIARVSDDEI